MIIIIDYKKNLNLKNILGITFAALWLYVIYSLSAQNANSSDSLSVKFASFIVKLNNLIFDESKISISYANHMIRKSAHFSAYMILAFTVGSVIRNFGIEKPKVFALTMAIASSYAVSDEFHQLFVPGRSGEFRDIMIDSAGAFLGVILALAIDQNFRKDKKLETS